MPDWSYRTLIRPVLFQAPAAWARDFALRAMGLLARVPLGPCLIDLLGHMKPDPRLQRCVLGLPCASPVGLGPGLDVHVAAWPALARFGFGFAEIGPITANPVPELVAVQRDDKSETVLYPNGPPNPGSAVLADQLRRRGAPAQPLFIRVSSKAPNAERVTSECVEVVTALAVHAAAFVLDTLRIAADENWSDDVWTAHLTASRDAAVGKPVWLCVPLDATWEEVAPRLTSAWELGVRGFVLDGKLNGVLGGPARNAALVVTAQLRSMFGAAAAIVAAGGTHEPAHVLQFLDAGADLVHIDTGLVYSGPGLAKRSNEAILRRQFCQSGSVPVPATESSWLWALLMGLAMFGGGILALLIAATRVLLPYDEVLGMTRDQLAAINPRLLAFMAHDRVSLAGTMIAVGIFYAALAWYGIRWGERWAKSTVLASALAGFASFFLFLGFGYFDPFHAFVTAILFQLLLLAWHGKLGAPGVPPAADLYDDTAWKRSQWGQLLFVVHGILLVGAGVVISVIGSTHVFVHEDLEFMQTTRATLLASNPRLLPLVAHDRASFGGMLISSGLAVLLPALWGFRRGAKWVWRMLLWAPLPAYVAAIGVHLVVGYHDLLHLAPAFGGAQLWLFGLLLSRAYLCNAVATVPHKS